MLELMADVRNEKLVQWRKSRHWTQEEAANALNIKRGYYSKLEAGDQAISKQLLVALDVMGFNDEPSEGENGSNVKKVSLLFGEMSKVPIVGNVSAGIGNTNVDVVEDEAWVPMSLQKLGGIGYVVDGESMMPSLQPGDIAIFREMRQPYARFTYLVKTEDDEYRCKNLEWRNNEWTLVSLNPNYRDEPLGSGQLLGMLIGWYRSIGKYEKLEANPDGLRLDQAV